MPRATRAASLICAALCLALLVSSAEAFAATPVWSPTSELTLPANADGVSPDASLSRVACATATSCTAAGSYSDADGKGRALVASKTGGTWSAARELELPADASTTDPGADPTALACAAAGACALGGVYIDDSGHTAALVATQSGGTWSQAAKLALPANTDATINALACGAAGSCSVVGSYDTADGTHAFIASLTGGAWSAATELDLPANADDGHPGAILHSVACGSDGACAAVGSYKDATTVAYRAMVVTQASGVWSPASELALPAGTHATDPGAFLNTVACGAAGSCAAFGSYTDGSGAGRTMVTELSGGSWSSASNVALPADARASNPYAYLAVACGGAGACGAAGSYLDASTSGAWRAMVVSRTNGVWSSTSLALPTDAHPTDPGASLNAVACGAAGSCAAAGSYLDASGAMRPMATSQSGASWSPATSLELAANADPANPGAYVSSVACGAAATCTLAGRYDAASGGHRAMVASAVPQDAAPPAQNTSPAPAAVATPAATTTPSKLSRPAVSLKTSRLRVAKGVVKVKLSCKSLPCSGTVKLTRISNGKTIVLGTAIYTIRRDKSKTIAVRLTKRGKAAFRRAHTHPVKVALVISVMGARTTRKTVVVR